MMLKKIMRKLGFIKESHSTLDEYLKYFVSLSSADQEKVIQGYLEEDTSSYPLEEQLAQKALGFWKIGKAKEALQHYNAALSLSPTNSTILLNRGNLYFELGRYKEAMKDFENSKNGIQELPDQLYINYNMIKTLGLDSPVLKKLAERNKRKFNYIG